MYEIFKKLMDERGITAYKVSKDTGISSQTLSAWKKDIYTPKQEKMELIANYFDVSVDYLMGRTPYRKPPTLPEPPENNEEAELQELCRQVSETLYRMNETQRQYALKTLELIKNMNENDLIKHEQIMNILNIK